jgi:tight adherence protein B
MTLFSFELDPLHLSLIFLAVAVILVGETLYLVFWANQNYRSNVNRRLVLLDKEPNREEALSLLRRERGMNAQGGFAIALHGLNRLVLRSGLTLGLPQLGLAVAMLALIGGAGVYLWREDIIQALISFIFCGTLLPLFMLRFLKNRRMKAFALQFPEAIDIIVRSLRAGHPVPVAIAMVAREMPDPIGSEFGLVTDEITYGVDLETAMRNLNDRVGQEDLPLFVTSIAIQSSTGGNLSQILDNLSKVIRERFKLRRKVRALSSEGRMSALILGATPFIVFGIINWMSPDFYGSIWNEPITMQAFVGLGIWMGIGLLIMRKMIDFRF